MSRISLGRAHAMGWFAATLLLAGCGGGFAGRDPAGSEHCADGLL